MVRELKVAVIGYGISGIATAIQLQRLGHKIVHFDRDATPAVVGYGMLLHPPAQKRLAQLGLLEAIQFCGAPVKHISAMTTGGKTIMALSYPNLSNGRHGLGIQRATLHRLLSSADKRETPVHSGCEIVSVDPTSGTLVDSNGVCQGLFDLVVVADGAHSALRKQLRARVRVDRLSKSAALVGLIDDPNGVATDRLVQYFGPSRHLSVWPVGCGTPGERPRCSIAMNVLLEDAANSRSQETWRQWASELWPELDHLIKAQDERPQLRIFSYGDVELAEHVMGRVVFVGDAAHGMSPQLGIGAQLALDDAAILANAIDANRSVTTALFEYQRTRLQQLGRLHRISRMVTQLFQSERRLPSLLRTHVVSRVMRMPAIQQLTQEVLLCGNGD